MQIFIGLVALFFGYCLVMSWITPQSAKQKAYDNCVNTARDNGTLTGDKARECAKLKE